METRKEVRVFQIERECEKCLEGKMIFTGESFSTFKTVYIHKCDKCKDWSEYECKYPRIEYEENKFKTLSYNAKRYISTGEDGGRVLLYGYPIDPDQPRGVWQCFGEIIPIAEEQQDKVKFQEMFLKEEIEIIENDGKKTAFIKSLIDTK